jgi:hypothetical protein
MRKAGAYEAKTSLAKSSFRGDLWEWRYRPSLDLAPWVRQFDDDHEPRPARCRMWRAIARARVVQERRR